LYIFFPCVILYSAHSYFFIFPSIKIYNMTIFIVSYEVYIERVDLNVCCWHASCSCREREERFCPAKSLVDTISLYTYIILNYVRPVQNTYIRTRALYRCCTIITFVIRIAIFGSHVTIWILYICICICKRIHYGRSQPAQFRHRVVIRIAIYIWIII